MESSLNSGGNRLPVYSLKTLRVHMGENLFIRTLSPLYVGYLTHWMKKRSKLCLYAECPSERHKCDLQWKGYASVEQWYPGDKAWFPAVLEITEALELDLRGIYTRGQVWEVWKTLSSKGEAEPVRGKLHEERDPASMPDEHDIVPVLKSLYHEVKLPIAVKSHVPDRVLVTPTAGDGPAIIAPKSPEETAAELEEGRRRWFEMRETMKNRPSPATTNGKVAHK